MEHKGEYTEEAFEVDTRRCLEVIPSFARLVQVVSVMIPAEFSISTLTGPRIIMVQHSDATHFILPVAEAFDDQCNGRLAVSVTRDKELPKQFMPLFHNPEQYSLHSVTSIETTTHPTTVMASRTWGSNINNEETLISDVERSLRESHTLGFVRSAHWDVCA
jgi:hypothetical protein